MLARLPFKATLGLLLGIAAPALGQSSRGDDAALEFFEKKVRPILVDNCYTCHSANTNAKGGLRVDDRNGLLHGGGRGPAVVPGQPDKSLLLQAVRHAAADLKMPPLKALNDQQVADLTQWIRDGAAWPQVRVPVSIGRPNARYEKLRQEHWAFQPLQTAPVPAVRDAAWPRSDVDRFVLAALEQKQLRPVADADPVTLLRRVTFDLTGLPPTPEEIAAFVRDPSTEAFAKVVDRLLASPAFGERWGRHWLDVARYGESTGSARNLPYPHAWRYRDYVIDAINRDRPYDQFIREQIAGDLLPAHSVQQRDEQLVATGFLALGVKDVNQRFKVRFIMDNIDEQIDTVSRAVLALTASCARCHDHKFDPIPTTDYYALAGIFHSTDLCAGLRNKMGGGGLDYYDTSLVMPLGPPRPRDLDQPRKIEQKQAELTRARAEMSALRDDPTRNKPGSEGEKQLAALRQRIAALQFELLALTDPAAGGPVALGARDSQTVGDTEVRIRGEAEKLGPVVPRGFLSAVQVPDTPKINPSQSGRLELAQWLTSPQNPLTARVMANRVWQHLFGEGLVISVDNFGVTGDVPSHPELLDHLARQFVQDGWSIKRLIRALALTRAYQLGSEAPAAHVALDPANRLVWRHSPRRLDAEEIRDAMLAVADQLDRSRFQGSPAQAMKVVELPNNGVEARRLEQAALTSRHRSVYLPLLRTLTPRSLEIFDFAEQGMVSGSRATTTVAPQALYLLNDPFVRRQSLALALKLLGRDELNDAARIDWAYRLTLGRPATEKDLERVRDFLVEYEVAVGQTGQEIVQAPDGNTSGGKDAPIGGAAPVSMSSADSGKNAAVPVEVEAVRPPSPRAAAWASFCQAILASAEFRYVR